MAIDPVVSIFAAANRPQLWMNLYENLSNTNIPFELIFVGNVKPDFNLPENFRFIYSTVKPAQCYYIGAMNCSGEYFMNIPDDVTFSNYCLDELLKFHTDNTSITSPQQFSHKGELMPHGFWENNNPPILPVASFMHKSLWNKVYIDKRFVALYWDVDIAMQVYQLGGKTNICPHAILTERGVRGLKGRLCFVKGDKTFFYSLWHTTSNKHSGEFKKQRELTGQPFEWTNNILKESQGITNDRWT